MEDTEGVSTIILEEVRGITTNVGAEQIVLVVDLFFVSFATRLDTLLLNAIINLT